MFNIQRFGKTVVYKLAKKRSTRRKQTFGISSRFFFLVIASVLCANAHAAWSSTEYVRDPSIYDTSSYSFVSSIPFVDSPDWDQGIVDSLARDPNGDSRGIVFDARVFEVALPDGIDVMGAQFEQDIGQTFDSLASLGPTAEVARLSIGARSTYPVTMELAGGRSLNLVSFVQDNESFYLAGAYSGKQQVNGRAAMAVRLKGNFGQTLYINGVYDRVGMVVALTPRLLVVR